jgi:hypothetical protein
MWSKATIFIVLLTIIIFSIYNCGTIRRNKEYSSRISRMNSFMEEYTKENIDTSIINHLDLIAKSLDTLNFKYFSVLANDSLIEIQSPKYFPVESKLNLYIKYDLNSQIQYIIENSLTDPSGSIMSIFDTNGIIILRDIYFYFSSLQIMENSKEYYNNGVLIKKKYSRKSTRESNLDLNDYTLDDNRYEFKYFGTVDDFKKNYGLN